MKVKQAINNLNYDLVFKNYNKINSKEKKISNYILNKEIVAIENSLLEKKIKIYYK